MSLVDPDSTVADFLHLLDAVGHEKHRRIPIHHLADAFFTFILELVVSHRQDLVDDQDIRVHNGGDGKAQPRQHTGGKVLDGHVYEPLQPGEGNDIVEALLQHLLGIADQGPVQEDILPGCQVVVEAGSQLNHGSDGPCGLHASLRGL